MDEVAAAAAVDPLAFRLRSLKDERMIAVLKAAAERFGWSEQKPSATRGYGLGWAGKKADMSPVVRRSRLAPAAPCGWSASSRPGNVVPSLIPNI
jgi:hypothetical protein